LTVRKNYVHSQQSMQVDEVEPGIEESLSFRIGKFTTRLSNRTENQAKGR